MKRMILNVVVGLLSFVIGTAITGFLAKQATNDRLIVAVEVTRKSNDSDYTKFSSLKDIPTNWKSENYWVASFYIPKELREQSSCYVDTIRRTFSSRKMNLIVGITQDDLCGNCSTFKEENVLIDGKKATIATYVKECMGITDYCYIANLYFPKVEGNMGLSFRVSGKDKAAQEKAKKIFGSITFHE